NTDRDRPKSRPLHDQHPQRNGNKHGDHHGNQHELDVIKCRTQDFRAMLHKERPIAQACAHAGTPGPVSSEAANSRTSGCSNRRNSCGGATATIRPACRRIIRDASNNASRKSCVTKTMVFPNRCASPRNSRCSSARVTGSSAPNGSSINKIGGSAANRSEEHTSELQSLAYLVC